MSLSLGQWWAMEAEVDAASDEASRKAFNAAVARFQAATVHCHHKGDLCTREQCRA